MGEGTRQVKRFQWYYDWFCLSLHLEFSHSKNITFQWRAIDICMCCDRIRVVSFYTRFVLELWTLTYPIGTIYYGTYKHHVASAVCCTLQFYVYKNFSCFYSAFHRTFSHSLRCLFALLSFLLVIFFRCFFFGYSACVTIIWCNFIWNKIHILFRFIIIFFYLVYDVYASIYVLCRCSMFFFSTWNG